MESPQKMLLKKPNKNVIPFLPVTNNGLVLRFSNDMGSHCFVGFPTYQHSCKEILVKAINTTYKSEHCSLHSCCCLREKSMSTVP